MLPEETKEDVLIEKRDSVAIVTLNRPKALNALNLEMIRQISACLYEWESDDNVKAVFFKGAGDRAFCAGGDIKSAYQAGMSYRRGDTNASIAALFFKEEYRFNKQLFHYPKPLFAFMDGIVMGGGYGVAGPCKYRIATDTTKFAMPEVGIGFFPDIGSMYYLNRCPDHSGLYLALTGATINVEDTIYTGLATHAASSDQIGALINRLAEKPDNESFVDDILKQHELKLTQKGSIEENRGVLTACFDKESLPAIMTSLSSAENEWAKSCHDLMMTRSPVSLSVACKHYMDSKGKTFDQIIAQDFVLAQHFLSHQDYYEGVRAAVIDKDRNPQWSPATLDDIKTEDIARYFMPTNNTLEEENTYKSAKIS